MFEQTRFQEVLVKIKIRQKQDHLVIDITLNEDGEVYVLDLVKKIADCFDFDESNTLLYFDTVKNVYSSLQEQEVTFVPFNNMVSENIMNLRVESKMSDEVLANPILKSQSGRSKRSPQRHIGEVLEVVETWRSLYTRGSFNQKGEHQKINLDRAALIIGVPRKSLQDYHLLLRNGYNYGFDFKENSRKKVGVLRNFVKQKKKNKSQQVIQKQKMKNDPKYEQMILTEIRKKIHGMTTKEYEQQLFKVVRNSSSDEDEVYEGIHQN